MDGINLYNVCIVFNVKASDDDEALSKVSRTLGNGSQYDWTWIYTTMQGKGEQDV